VKFGRCLGIAAFISGFRRQRTASRGGV